MDIKKTTAKMKRALTLIEMIVVLMLLTTISGALAYNYMGSLNRGLEFVKNETISRIHAILEVALANGEINSQTDADDWESKLAKSPLAKDSTKMAKIANEVKLKVTYNPATQTEPASLQITP